MDKEPEDFHDHLDRVTQEWFALVLGVMTQHLTSLHVALIGNIYYINFKIPIYSKTVRDTKKFIKQKVTITLAV